MENVIDWHYKNDRQIGSRISVDLKDIYAECNADLIDIVSSAPNIDPIYRKNAGISSLVYYGENSSLVGGIDLSFYVGGSDRHDAEYNVNKLIAMFNNGVHSVETDEDDFIYDVVLLSFSSEKTLVEYFYLVELSCAAVKRFAIHHEESKNNYVWIDNPGVVSSGVRLTVTANEAVKNASIGEIVIKNLKANVPFVIDGINGTITENGVNRFTETNLISFPKVSPGKNYFKLTPENKFNVIAEYYPTFLV